MLRARHADGAGWHDWCDPAERARAAEVASNRWARICTGRGSTRWYLAQLLGCPRDAVPIVRPTFRDRPTLDREALPDPWKALSYSRSTDVEHTWTALGLGPPVGLDVEVSPARDPEAVNRLTAHLNPSGPTDALDRWLRYEAWCKALGTGIGMLAEDPPEDWTFTDFDPGQGTRGVVATRWSVKRVRVVEVQP